MVDTEQQESIMDATLENPRRHQMSISRAMDDPMEQLKLQLQTAIENKDAERATMAIEELERGNITLELLEGSRIGRCVNKARKEMAEMWPRLAKRCRALIKAWQGLCENAKAQIGTVACKTLKVLSVMINTNAEPERLRSAISSMGTDILRFQESSNGPSVGDFANILSGEIKTTMDWLVQREKNRRHSLTERMETQMDNQLYDALNNFDTDEDSVNASAEEHASSFAFDTANSTSKEKVKNACINLAILAPRIFNLDAIRNAEPSKRRDEFNAALWNNLLEHKIIPDMALKYRAPYLAAMLHSDIKTMVMDILRVLPMFNLSISSLFPLMEYMFKGEPMALKTVLQDVLDKERELAGSSGGAKNLYEKMVAWKRNFKNSHFKKELSELDKKQRKAIKSAKKRKFEAKSLQHRLYQTALGDTLQNVEQFEHVLHGNESAQSLIDTHGLSDCEINSNDDCLIVFMVRLSTLMLNPDESAKLINDLLVHSKFIVFIYYDTAKIGVLSRLLSESKCLDDMMGVPMHVNKTHAGGRRKMTKTAEGPALLSLKPAHLNVEERANYDVIKENRESCKNLEKAFRHLNANSVIDKIGCIIKVVDPVV